MHMSQDEIIKPVVPARLAFALVLGWAILVAAGFAATYQFTERDRGRELQQWQRQLQLTVESQRRQVEQWLGAQQAVISGLAQNVSLQLYVTELNAPSQTGDNYDQSYTAFLRNLLISEASQHGYYEPKMTDEVPANLPATAGPGLAILGKDGTPIVGTLNTPELSTLPQEVVEAFKAHAPSPIGPFTLADGRAYLLFTAPIAAVQADETSAPEGYIVGIKVVGADFMELLSLPPQAAPSSESLLVSKQGETITYLTPLQDGTKPMALNLNMATPNLAEAFTAQHPGVFIEQIDYRSKPVLEVGQNVPGTEWTLIHKVDAKVAFSDTEKRKRTFLIGYALLAGLLTVAFFATSRNIIARRAKEAALHYQQLADSAERQKSLLSRLVNTLIMLVDSRDPNAQHHSNGVKMVAEAIAGHMALSEEMKETTILAASLMNVGKIKTPEALLQQKELSIEDKKHIRQAILASAEILKDVPFDGPVVETLQQALEHVDGSGPLRLKDNDILVSAKIIAVANAFIAMISKRGYRDAMSMDQALDLIHQATATLYARPVVAALDHYLENGGGRDAVSSHMGISTIQAKRA